MSGFTDIFGGSPVSPAEVAYAFYEFSADLELVWPQFANGNPNVAARFMNLVCDVSSANVFMPDATLVSVGYDTIIFNSGGNIVNIQPFDGVGDIILLFPGDTYYLMLSDNSTKDGTWITLKFGAGTSSADASALAGAGLLALAGLLAVNLNAVTVSTSYTLTAVARDVLQVWKGGSGVITLPAASTAGNGFLFPLANNGSGSVTVTPVGGDLIDGESTSVFAQTQSGFVISTGNGWVTVGKGIQNTFAVTLLNLNVGGSSDVTETSAQAQNIIQQYTGVLTGDINVIVPNTVQLYYIFNDTSGSFALTVKTAAGSGVSVAQGTHAILYCDGTNVVNAFTATITSTLTIPTGSASSPSLNVQGSLTTGLFSAAVNTISTSAGGNEVTRYASAASSVNHITETASATGQPVLIGSAGSDAVIPITVAGKGGGATNFPNAVITGGTVDGAVIGGVTPTTIQGTTITATTGFAGNLTGTAPAGSLTGTTLASNVVNSSLTSVGTLANLTVTAPINASVTGNAATVTTNANLTGPITSTGNATAIASNINLPGSPTTTTQAANDISTKIATTAFANPGALLSANGYVKLPSGVIIQWGTTGNVTNGGTLAVALPFTFPSLFASVTANPTGTPGGAQGQNVALISSTSQFVMHNNSSATEAFNWMAIGY